MAKKDISTSKSNGRIYTPDFIVNSILDLSGYYGENVLRKHVIDNSCGNGSFLINIAQRYCAAAVLKGYDGSKLANELSCFIHGIEIDKAESEKCIQNLNSVAEKYNLSNVQWDIKCANTLSVKEFNGKMDFVLGNPPYIRVHNLNDSFNAVKSYGFSQNGMTDLYIAFYEIGLNMLNEGGVLGYITPSSFFNSVAAATMRAHFVSNNLLDKIVDLKHYQAFNATTYTTIAILKKSRIKKDTDYYEFDTNNKIPYYVDTLTANDYYIAGNFYFANKERLHELKNIIGFTPCVNYAEVKNGFATLADGFFIKDFDFNEFVIPVIKASTGKWTKCLFPYKHNKLVPFNELTSYPHIKQYYDSNIMLLKNRSLENISDWYGFGRTQGINDVSRLKYAVNSLIRTKDDIKLNVCNKGCGVYGGLYILTDIPEAELRSILQSDEFANYVSMLGKYKSGGYYTFSSKDLKLYVNYKYSQKKGIYNEQCSFFANS